MISNGRVIQQSDFIIDVATNLFISILQSAQNQFHQFFFSSNSLGKDGDIFKPILTVKFKLKQKRTIFMCLFVS